MSNLISFYHLLLAFLLFYLRFLFLTEFLVHPFQLFELFLKFWVAKTLLFMMILGLSASIANKAELTIVVWSFYMAFVLIMKYFMFLNVMICAILCCFVSFFTILALLGLVVEAQALIFLHSLLYLIKT